MGPFLSKNFATSISPWVVTLEALEPFRTPGPVQDPPPLPYLRAPEPRTFDIHLEVSLQTAGLPQPYRLTASNFRFMYWSIDQQVAHHTVTGCNLRRWRPVGQWNDQRSHTGSVGLFARKNLGPKRTAAVAQRREPNLSGGWRSGNNDGMVPGTVLSCWLRRGHRSSPACSNFWLKRSRFFLCVFA